MPRISFLDQIDSFPRPFTACLHNNAAFSIVFNKQSKVKREGELGSVHVITNAVADDKQVKKHFTGNLEGS